MDLELMKAEKKVLLWTIAALCCFAPAWAEGRQIPGSGPFVQRPGLAEPVRRIIHEDIARSRPGDYFWREIEPRHPRRGDIYRDAATGKNWGWLVINQGDIDYARQRIRQNTGFMAGFQPTLPGVDESGEQFMEYRRTGEHSRRLYEGGTVEDTLTGQAAFNAALREFQKKYSVPVPRRSTAITGATNWYYHDAVPRDFPDTFWASVTLEGRIMKVIVANGPGHRIAVSYWAQPEFMREYPNATWAWAGQDQRHSRGAPRIQEDISTSGYFEYAD
jgi:hypothetical protein